MTTPPTPLSSVPALVWRHADDALRAEEAAAKQVAGPLRNQLDDILQDFRLRWVRTFGKLTGQQSGPVFNRLLFDLGTALSQVSPGDPVTELIRAATDGHALGVRQGFIEAGLDAVPRPVVLDLATYDYAAGVADSAQGLVDRAARIAPTLQRGSFTAVQQTIAVAQQGANQFDRAARTVTNEQINAGISTVTDELGGTPLWIAERDACATCLALSGHLADEHGEFDLDATFGSQATAWTPEDGILDGPPRHPNCRCRLSPWFGHDTAGAESITHDWSSAIADAQGMRHQAILLGDREGIANANRAIDAAHAAAAAARKSAAFDLPAALRREAERSVLKGWALPSEPNSIRSKAAERLLNRIAGNDGRAPSGWQVPKSVRKGTEVDLKKGRFHTKPFPGK